MAAADLPLVSMLKTRLHWHQARQKLLAENVANADTPGFRPKDLRPPSFRSSGSVRSEGVAVERTDPAHLALAAARPGENPHSVKPFEVTPSGNAINLEDEMLKSSQNQSDFQLAASLYSKSMQMLRTAIGRGGR